MEALEKRAQELEKQVKGGETLIQAHKTEIGEARQKIEEFYSEFKDIVGDKEKFKKTIDSLKEKMDNSNQGQSQTKETAQGGANGGADILDESKLTADQKAKADEVFKKLKPEERIAIASDKDKKIAFLKAAVEAVPDVPESLFGKKEESGKESANEFRRLFGLAEKEKNFVPGSKRSGASGFSGAEGKGKQEEQEFRRLLGGKIPRPQSTP